MMKKLEAAFQWMILSGCVLGIVSCFSLTGIEITTGQKVHETIKYAVDGAKESVPSLLDYSQTWINNSDNLLTLLGTLAGLLMSGGFWTWRKGAAFQRGFTNGWNQRGGIQLPRETEYQDMEQKYDSLLYDHTNNLMLLGIARKDIQALQEQNLANQELRRQWTRENDQLKVVHADQQQRIAQLSKDRDAWKAECMNKSARLDESNTRIKQAEENHLQSYGPAKEAGKEEGRQELAAKIIEHLLATEQASYVLNQKTGAVTLTMKQVGQLSPVLSSLIIALSGCMTPKRVVGIGMDGDNKGKLFVSAQGGGLESWGLRPEEPHHNLTENLGEVTGTFTTADPQYAKLFSAMQQAVSSKETEKKAELCIYCKKEPVNPGYVLEYKGMCLDCGNNHGMDLKRLFVDITGCAYYSWQFFLDMPIREFIDKFGPLKTKEGMPLNSERDDGKITWRSDYTVRDYIQTYGMFKKG